MKKDKKWEVIITTIVSITGVIIAGLTYGTNRLQAKVAKNESLPNFVVEEKAEYDEIADKTIDTVIEISNLEGRLNNYNSETITILQCQYIDEEGEFYSADIPVENYYIIGVKSGNKVGVIEKRKTGSNYVKLANLENDISRYNRELNMGTLTIIPKSYIKISYMNLLDEKETAYYETEILKTNLIDNEIGQQQFDEYHMLSENDLGLNFNTTSNVKVQELIDKITNASEKRIEFEIEEKRRKVGMDIIDKIVPLLNTLLSTTLGACLAYFFGIKQQKKIDKMNKMLAASQLYYDLKSIEDYLKEETGAVNLRYSNQWQVIVAQCAFLEPEQVKKVYDIYDKVYNYNYYYKSKEKRGKEIKKDSISYYGALKGTMFGEKENIYNSEYKELLECLNKEMQKR